MSETRNVKKDRSRERILDSAGSLIREKGIAATSVSEVMEGAGMTVGGFYAHFPSKQTLMAETLKETISKSMGLLASTAEGKRGGEWIRAVARSYLSKQHRDNPELGCPLPSILSEATREDPPVAAALAEEIQKMVDALAPHLKEAGSDDPKGDALALLSIMVGGLAFSRAIQDKKLSDAILQGCRRQIDSLLAAY